MKKIDFGQTTTILANLGVIAGIVFLAIELSQNNELLEAQTRRERLDVRMFYAPLLLDGIAIAPIQYKLRRGEPVTPEEEEYYWQYTYINLALWEWQFDEYVAGTIGLEELPVEGWRGNVRLVSTIYADAWEIYSATAARSQEFVAFMNENVFD